MIVDWSLKALKLVGHHQAVGINVCDFLSAVGSVAPNRVSIIRSKTVSANDVANERRQSGNLFGFSSNYCTSLFRDR